MPNKALNCQLTFASALRKLSHHLLEYLDQRASEKLFCEKSSKRSLYKKLPLDKFSEKYNIQKRTDSRLTVIESG